MNPLTLFPRHPSAPDTYYISGAWAPAAITAVDKRFTDAELAAEYHAAHAIFQRNIWQEMSRGEDWTEEEWTRLAEPLNSLHRFATLPHYDEDAA